MMVYANQDLFFHKKNELIVIFFGAKIKNNSSADSSEQKALKDIRVSIDASKNVGAKILI